MLSKLVYVSSVGYITDTYKRTTMETTTFKNWILFQVDLTPEHR